MNNCAAGITGVALSVLGFVGIADPATVEEWLKTGAFGAGTALLIWQLLRAYRRQDELQKQATAALQKCASCPLATAANENYLHSHQNDHAH